MIHYMNIYIYTKLKNYSEIIINSNIILQKFTQELVSFTLHKKMQSCSLFFSYQFLSKSKHRKEAGGIVGAARRRKVQNLLLLCRIAVGRSAIDTRVRKSNTS